MKVRGMLFLGLCFLVLGVCSGIAGAKEIRESVSLTAEVLGISKSDRTLILGNDKGEVVSMAVTPEARNFDQIQIGDTLRVTYQVSVALFLGKEGELPKANANVVMSRSELGEKPAGVIAKTIDISATILSLDRKNRTAELELPDGRITTTKVDPTVKAFDTLKPGDLVHARYTEAMAISVETL